jgi:hypothetical protein
MSTVTRDGPRTWTIEGRTLTLPVEIRDARLAFAIYRTPATDAGALLAGTPFRPLTVGQAAICVAVFVRYLDGDLDSYDEFGIGTVVRGINGRPGVFVHHLPVTEEFTMHAGRWVWGLPKYLVQSGCIVEQRQVRVQLSTDEQFIVAGSLTAPHRIPGRFRMRTAGWSTALEGPERGTALQTPGRMRLHNLRIGRKGSELSWGDHALSQDALRLRMQGTPLVTVTAHGRLSIDAAQPTSPAPLSSA